MSRFVRPETEKLELSEGDWVLVKRRLTAGESRRAMGRTFKSVELVEGGKIERKLDPEEIGLSVMVVYLLDWSLTDDTGKVVTIRDQPESVIENALLQLDPSSFQEISDAIDQHVIRQRAELEQEKKDRSGGSKFQVISQSAG